MWLEQVTESQFLPTPIDWPACYWYDNKLVVLLLKQEEGNDSFNLGHLDMHFLLFPFYEYLLYS